MTTITSSARQVAWPVAIWIVAMLTLGVGAAGVIAADQVPVGLDLLWQPLLAISASAVGTFILVKRPGHGIGRICLGAGLVTSFSMLARGLPDIGGGAFASISSGGAFGVLAAQLTILIAMVLIGPILIGAFPTGRFSVVSRWVIAAMLALALPVMVVFVGGSPTVSSDGFFAANPLWISLLPVDAGTTGNLLGLGLYAVGLALAAVALALRYRRSGTIERLQIRWVAANAFVIVTALVSMALDPFGVSVISPGRSGSSRLSSSRSASASRSCDTTCTTSTGSSAAPSPMPSSRPCCSGCSRPSTSGSRAPFAAAVTRSSLRRGGDIGRRGVVQSTPDARPAKRHIGNSIAHDTTPGRWWRTSRAACGTSSTSERSPMS